MHQPENVCTGRRLVSCDQAPNTIELTGGIALKVHLAEATVLIGRALNNGGRTVQVASYQSLQELLARLEKWVVEAFAPGELQTPLESLIKELLLREVDVSAEVIRKERAQATLAYIQLCQKTGFAVPEQLRSSVIIWRESERSEQVQHVLGVVAEKLVPR